MGIDKDTFLHDGAHKITAGTRRQYAEQSLLWTQPSTRSEDEYLQRIWNLANDVIVLEAALRTVIEERDAALEAVVGLCRNLDAIEEIVEAAKARLEA